ncbi:Ribonuclease P protein subunit p30 [Mucor circinelloides]
MYCDLNIPCSAQADRSAIDKLKLILSRLTQLNEATVALNYTMESKIPKPIDENTFDPSILNSKYPLKLYKRVTIDTINPHHIAELRNQFDLIALRTNDYTIFHAACQSKLIDIISLHVDERLAFELSSVDIKNALERNIYFEICYAPAIRDTQARTYTVQLAKQLFEYTQGRNVIISSEAQTVSELRNPADVFYFAKSIGFPNDKAKFTVEKHCEQLLNSRLNVK